MDNLCEDGRCSNTFGSFMCTCNDGYQIDDANAMCVGKLITAGVHFDIFFFMASYSLLDINECLEDPLICGVGACVNTDGGYNCVCPEGYVLLPGGSKHIHEWTLTVDAFIISAICLVLLHF